MADEDDSGVTLGEGKPVEGAPLARVGARLMWGIEKSTVLDREGDTVIRSPEGPRTLADVLREVEEPYFATQREFERAVRDVIGDGPVPTADTESEDDETTHDQQADETGSNADHNEETAG